jgi:predicted kinase
MGTPTLIIVSGPGGSGKTTLAHQLATTLGCPALCRDEIKEGMAASNPGFVPATSDYLTERTYHLFFEVIALFLKAEVSHVAEAAFQHRLWSRGLEALADMAMLRVIRCQAPDELTRQRALTRLYDAPTRASHADLEHFSAHRTFDPLHLDAPTLDVDTSDGWRPDLELIAAFCRRR